MIRLPRRRDNPSPHKSTKPDDTTSALKTKFSGLSELIEQNQTALDLLLASTITNNNCRVYVDQTLKIQTDLKEVKKDTRIFPEMQKNQENIFNETISRTPNLNIFTMKKLIATITTP